MKNTYLNDFHRQRSERLTEQLSKQPKVSLEDAMKQYDQIKRGSSRRQRELQRNVIIKQDGEPVVIDPAPMMEQESKVRRLANLQDLL
jgi:chorismate-pyruvate lyase